MTKTEIGYLKKLGYVDTKEHGAVLFHPGISNALREDIFAWSNDDFPYVLEEFYNYSKTMQNFVIAVNKVKL
jgi:hypothetical protein|tara:strand:+ start:469 stop:684 length:216 start_codon:yes stop_codon:yes gene_type:complete